MLNSGGQAGRRAGGQAGRRVGGQADRRADGQTGRRAGGQAGRRAGGRTGGQAGRRAGGQADRRAGGHEDTRTRGRIEGGGWRDVNVWEWVIETTITRSNWSRLRFLVNAVIYHRHFLGNQHRTPTAQGTVISPINLSCRIAMQAHIQVSQFYLYFRRMLDRLIHH